MVGSLARIINNSKFLNAEANKYLKNSKIDLNKHNPFYNNFAQAIELLHYREEAIDILKKLRINNEEPIKPKRLSGHGIAAIEVPRGILWHEYKIEDGIITYANILTPTAQNLRNMQEDIFYFLPLIIKMEKKQLIQEIEKLIRAYDPCFSCSTHFLELEFQMPKELEELKRFHCHLGPMVVIGYRMGLVAKKTLNAENKKLKAKLFCGNKPPLSCIADGVQFSTGCTLGKGNIEMKDCNMPVAEFRANNKRIRIKLKSHIIKLIKTLRYEHEEDISIRLYTLSDEELFCLEYL